MVSAAVTTLSPGDPAPGFTTRNQHGQPVGNQDPDGRPTILVFYPWAFSGICTSELGALSEAHDELAATGARVLAISCDAMFTLRAFAESQNLPFDLLTDHWPHGEIARAYGVFDPQAGCAVRGTFVIDAGGTVVWSVVNEIGQARALADLVAGLAALTP